MVEEKKYRSLTWLAMRSPEAEEIDAAMRRFDIPPHIGNELRHPSRRQRADIGGHFVYGAFHFPLLSSADATDPGKEIDFLVGKDFIITAHYGKGDPLHEFSKLFEVNSLLGKSAEDEHAGHIFFYILKHIYRGMELEIEKLDREFEDMEEDIFSGREKEMVRSLSEASRTVLELTKTLTHQEAILRAFADGNDGIFGGEFRPYIESLQADYAKICLSAEACDKFLDKLRETNLTLLTTKQNETLKFFAAISFVTFPLSLLVSILAIESPSNPLTGRDDKFLIILGIVAIVCVLLFGIFKRKRWI